MRESNETLLPPLNTTSFAVSDLTNAIVKFAGPDMSRGVGILSKEVVYRIGATR